MEDGVLSNGKVHSSLIYKSKYDVTTYRAKVAHLRYEEKVDLTKKIFVLEKSFRFQETIRSFKYKRLLLFPLLCYSDNEDVSYLWSCVFLVMSLLLKFLGLRIYFYIPSVLFVTLEVIVKAKRRKLMLHRHLFKVFIFQHGLNFFSNQSHEINLLCDRKHKHKF